MYFMRRYLYDKIILALAAFIFAGSILLCIKSQGGLSHVVYGSCKKCRRTWDVVPGHLTPYADAHWTVTTTEGTNLVFEVVGFLNDGGKHNIMVTNGVSCFPLCEQCWTDLKTPAARLPYYRKLADERKKWDTVEKAEDVWSRMKASVLAGN
jgi:hypothetical protein